MTLCLIVDDDKMACKVAADIAGSMGLEIAMEFNGLTAVAYCEKRMPEIIVLDVVMPKLDGVGFMKQMRKMMGGQNPFVIACTARSDIDTVTALKGVGINAYIVKPFKPEQLQEKIKASGKI